MPGLLRAEDLRHASVLDYLFVVQAEVLRLIRQCLPRREAFALRAALVLEHVRESKASVRADLAKRDAARVGLVDQKLSRA